MLCCADLCSSLSDFWSRRWNLTAGNALRFLVYDPISEGRLVRQPGAAPTTGRAVRRAGVVASFVVSGIVHELIFWSTLFPNPCLAHRRIEICRSPISVQICCCARGRFVAVW